MALTKEVIREIIEQNNFQNARKRSSLPDGLDLTKYKVPRDTMPIM